MQLRPGFRREDIGRAVREAVRRLELGNSQVRSTSPFRVEIRVVMFVFAIVLVVIGLKRWLTDGSIVPLGPGLLMLGAAATMFYVLTRRSCPARSTTINVRPRDS